MERLKDADQDFVQEGSIVLKRHTTKPLEDAGADVESDFFAANLRLEQMHNDLLDVGQLLGGLIGVLADESNQEGSECGDQVLHIFAPIGIERGTIEDR